MYAGAAGRSFQKLRSRLSKLQRLAEEHPQSPWAPVLPHTFKRRRKFENSQPPSSLSLFLLPHASHTLCSPAADSSFSPTNALLMFQASPPRPSPNLPDWPSSVAGEGRQELRRLPEASTSSSSSTSSGTRKRERESTAARGGHNPAAEEPDQLVPTLQRPILRPCRRHSTHLSSVLSIASSQQQ
jgi:hypothetical protein